MKFTIKQDHSLDEDEIIVIHNRDPQTMTSIYNFLLNQSKATASLEMFSGDSQYYINIDELVFFETNNNIVYAHTLTKAYETKYKLYELEEILPDFFVRISKSAICNVNYIHSISRNLTSLRLISFKNSNKSVYVSRMYYANLKLQLEKRLHNELQKK